jgi:hypothetical protein
MRKIILSFALLFAVALPVSSQTNPAARGNVHSKLCKNHYILSAPDPCFAAPSAWVATADMHEARSGHTATLLKDGTVLVAGGGVASAELYDQAAGTWTLTGPLSRARTSHTATLLPNGKVLVLGDAPRPSGCCIGIDTSGEIYDPATGEWTSVEPMPSPRTWFTATLLDSGKVLVVGGIDTADEMVTTAHRYDPETNSWTSVGTSGAVFWHTATKLHDGRVLITGGVPDDWLSIPLRTSVLYDPVSGAFVPVGNMEFARAEHTATLLADGSVLVAGGFYKDYTSLGGYCVFDTLAFTERFDPSTNSWVKGGMQSVPRMWHASTLLADQSVLLTGGEITAGNCPSIAWSTLQSSEVSGASQLTWGHETSMQVPRANHTATLLTNGSVLVTGGVDGNLVLKSAEVYGPAR